MSPIHLSVVDDGAPEKIPTPRDVAQATSAVGDLPVREERPTTEASSDAEESTFSVAVSMLDAQSSRIEYHDITHWRVYDGSLTLYTRIDGRIARYVSIAPHEWWGIERLVGGER